MILPIAPRPAVIKHVKTRREFQWRESSTSVGIVSLTPLEFPHTGSVVIQYTREEGGLPMAAFASPQITRNDAVLHGVPIVAGTRIPVWVISEYAADGLSPEEIAGAFDDTLTPAQIRTVLAAVQGLSLKSLGAPDNE